MIPTRRARPPPQQPGRAQPRQQQRQARWLGRGGPVEHCQAGEAGHIAAPALPPGTTTRAKPALPGSCPCGTACGLFQTPACDAGLPPRRGSRCASTSRGDRALGPGKVRLLELVGETGSISAAGRAMGMSYRRAWMLVDALNRTFSLPVVETRGGGAGGGGASLTPFGAGVIENYRAMEHDARDALARRLAELERALAPSQTQARAAGGTHRLALLSRSSIWVTRSTPDQVAADWAGTGWSPWPSVPMHHAIHPSTRNNEGKPPGPFSRKKGVMPGRSACTPAPTLPSVCPATPDHRH